MLPWFGQARNRAAHEFRHKDRAGGGHEREAHHAEPAHFEQTRQGLGRPRHAIRADLHLIIRDQYEAPVKQPQQKVRLPRPRSPGQQNAQSIPSGTTRMHQHP